MPVQGDDYVKLSRTDITTAIETELRNEFGQDIDLTEGSVFGTFAEVLGAILASNQEESLEDVFESAFLDTATGENLDKLVTLVGIARRAAAHATGVVRFDHGGPATQDYVIQSGTTVQTDSNNPTEFETSETAFIEFVDGFEDGNVTEYSGDTADATVVTTNVRTGGNALQFGATAGSHIYRSDIVLKEGSTHHCYMRPETGTTPIVTFFVQADDVSDYYQVALDLPNDEARLERIDDGVVSATLDTTTAIGLTVDEYHEVEFSPTLVGNRNVTIYDRNGTELATLSATDDTYTEGFPGFKSGDATGNKQYDDYTTSQVSANIRASLGGTGGNVGPNTITVMPSPPTGADSVTNLYSTGDPDFRDRNQSAFIVGEAEETDSQLRERVRSAVTGGGDATHDALVFELINNVDGVRSVTVHENKTEDDNTGTGGLPPHSFEVVVFGGTDQDIAEAIFDKKAITARDYGGANGTAVTITVTAPSNQQQRDISFSRPAALDVDITLDVVITENYIGDDAVRDLIVEYVGGVRSDGSSAVGLSVETDVVIDVIRDIVIDGPTDEDTGIRALDQSVDGAPLTTTPSTTTVDGVEVVDVGADEVAQTDATDGSITINTRQQ